MEDPKNMIIEDKERTKNGHTETREIVENKNEPTIEMSETKNSDNRNAPPSTPVKCKTQEENKGEITNSQGAITSNGDSPQKSSHLSKSKKSPESESMAQWMKARRQQGSPRKYHQGLKQTGLLMNSPRTYRIAASPSKKRQGSASSSPEKQSPSRFRNVQGLYLENLMIVLESVQGDPENMELLGEEDVGVIEKFYTLSLRAQKLYVRLLQRKLDLKRLTKVVYDNICDPEDMVNVSQELVEAGFLLKEEDLGGLPEFLEVLTAPEVTELCKQMKVRAKGNKEDKVKSLISFSQKQRPISNFFVVSKAASSKPSDSPLFKKAREMAGPCLKLDPQVHRVFLRVLMLYSLPSYDDIDDGGPQAALTALLLIDLGKTRFPVYTIQKTRVIFRTRNDLLRFEDCCLIHQKLQKYMEDKKLDSALQQCQDARDIYGKLSKDELLIEHDRSLPRFLRRFTGLSLLVYMLSVMVELYQKLKQYDAAVALLEELLAQDTYLQNHRGRWYIRLALNLHVHLRKPAKALDVIERALRDPELQRAHLLTLSTRARRLANSDALAERVAGLSLMEPIKLPGVVIQGRCMNSGLPGVKRTFIRGDSDRHAGEGLVNYCYVEELVIGHYKEMGYSEGLHREGTTMNSLFGLLLWDVLYTPVPDAFRSPHQGSPIDLLDEDFYTARKEIIDSRLSAIRSWSEEEADAEVARVWLEHENEQCLVAWNIFSSLTFVQGLVKSLGFELLASVFERLAKNYRHTRSGFPDLIVWNPSTKKARIVEVKGPNDTLSEKQEVWLEFLLSCGAEAEVCHVEAIGAKKMTKAPPGKVSPKKGLTKKAAKRTASDSDSDYVPSGAKRVTRTPRNASIKKASPKEPAGNAKRDSGSDSEVDCTPPGATRNSKRTKKKSETSDEEYTPPSSHKTRTANHNSDDSNDFASESEVWRKPKRKNERRGSK